MSNEIKILLISPIPPPIGGIASWTVRYLDWMKKNYYSVVLVDSKTIGTRAKQKTTRINIFSEIIRTFNIISKVRKKYKKRECKYRPY